MRLRDKFTRSFVILIFMAIISSIILSVILLNKFNTNLKDNKIINNIVKTYSYESAVPPIVSARTIIYKEIQPLIYQINQLKKYFLLYYNNTELFDYEDTDAMTVFLEKYTYNCYDFASNYNVYYNKILNSNQTNPFDYLDSILWYRDTTTTTLSQLDNQSFKILYAIANITPLLRSFYQSYMLYKGKGASQIFFYISEYELYIMYPVISLQLLSLDEDFRYNLAEQYDYLTDKNNNLKAFVSYINPSTCTNNNLKTPTYFFAPCRNWYIESEQFHKDIDKEVIVSTPYKYATSNEDIGISICNRFVISSLTTHICIDKINEALYNTLDQLNKIVDGYYFITRVESNKPFYYPEMNSFSYLSTLTKHEFDLNITYYTDEINAYLGIEPNLINYNETYNSNLNFKTPIFEGYFSKDSENITYTLFPISFYSVPEDPEAYSHMLNIVFMHLKTASQNLLQESIEKQLPKIVLQTVLFVLYGLIIIFLIWHLIVNLADNIVSPIKDLKKIIQGLQSRQGFSSDIKFNEYGQQIINIKDSIYGNTNNALTNSTNAISNTEDNDDEKTIMLARSKQIDYIFNLLFKLKKVMGFATSGEVENEDFAFLDYILAKATFKEVNNIKGNEICESNLGNISIKLKKYDKAILHFKTSIEPIKYYFPKSLSDYSEVFNLKDKKSKIKKSRKNFSAISNSSSHKTSISFNNDDKEQIESLKSNFLESRYPKLLYSLKSFFKSIYYIIEKSKYTVTEMTFLKAKQLKYIIDKENKDKKKEMMIESEKLTDKDIFSLMETHSLSFYHQTLKEYLYLSVKNGKIKQVIEATLEYNEFLINYKLKENPKVEEFLKMKNNVSVGVSNPSLNNNSKKPINTENDTDLENLIEAIYGNFLEIDKYLEQIKLTIDMEYIRNYSTIIKNSSHETSNEQLDTPIFIINSKVNFLKGKYYQVIGNWKNAFRFFSEAYSMGIISNAQITIEAGNSIIELISNSLNLLDFEKHYIETVNLHDVLNINYAILLGQDYDIEEEIDYLNKKEEEVNNKSKIEENNNTNNIAKTIKPINQTKTKKDNNKDNNDIYQQTLLLKLKSVDKSQLLKEIKNKSKELNSVINCINEFLEVFISFPKDIILLVDANLQYDIKKVEQYQYVLKEIFNKLITKRDRFSLACYGPSFNILIQLIFKNKITINYLNKEIESINSMIIEGLSGFTKKEPHENNDFDNTKEQNYQINSCSNIIKSIICSFNYLNVKTFNKREKWVIVLSDFIDNEQIELLDEKMEKHVFNMSNPLEYNLVIISFRGASHIKDTYLNNMKELFSKKTKIKNKVFICFDEIEILKNIMRSIGIINEDLLFSNEKYSSKN